MFFLKKFKTWAANQPIISRVGIGAALAWVLKQIGADLMISPISDFIKSSFSKLLGNRAVELLGFYLGNFIFLCIAIALVFLAFRLGKMQINRQAASSPHDVRLDRDWVLSIAVAAGTLLMVFLIFDRPSHEGLTPSDIADGYWEPLTSREIASLSAKLGAVESVPIVVSCAQQSCRALARSLVEAFQSASWTNVQSSVGGIDAVGIEGIVIFPIDETSRTLRKMIEENTSLSIDLTGEERNSGSYPATFITIGTKPL